MEDAVAVKEKLTERKHNEDEVFLRKAKTSL